MSDINSNEFQMRIVVLDSGQALLAQVMTQDEGKGNIFLYVMDPLVVWTDTNGTPHMAPWMPMSDDRIFPIPVDKIVTIPTPNQSWVDAYIEFHRKYVTEQLRLEQARAADKENREVAEKEAKNRMH